MDERREERLELEALARADRDDAREAAEARAFWQDEGLEPFCELCGRRLGSDAERDG